MRLRFKPRVKRLVGEEARGLVTPDAIQERGACSADFSLRVREVSKKKAQTEVRGPLHQVDPRFESHAGDTLPFTKKALGATRDGHDAFFVKTGAGLMGADAIPSWWRKAEPRPWRQWLGVRRILSLTVWLVAGQAGGAAEAAKDLPGVSVASGYFEAPVALKVTSPVEGAVLRYTVDGSEPTEMSGADFHDSLVISNTTPLRVAAFKEGVRVSGITTRSYLFLEQVIHQSASPAGFPAGPSAWNGQRSAYEMNPRVVNDPLYRDRIKESLEALPVLSIVFREGDFFGAREGIYVNSLQRGERWERPCSVELIPADGAPGFQIDCGIRVQGNYNRIPDKSPKHSLRLFFKEKYGASKLHYPVFPDSAVQKFDTLVLRADYNNSWVHWDRSGQMRGQRMRDAWMKDSHRAMGWTAAHNRYVHLYLNGLYWGIYDITERPDASFAAAYFGGKRAEYDVINEGEIKDGSGVRFQRFQWLRGLSQGSQYNELGEQLDVIEYIDYLLLNYYAGNLDWGENKNWYAIGRRDPPGRFQFFVWDGEFVLQELNDDIVNAPFEVPFRLAEVLKGNAEFRRVFAERVQKHFFGEGALTPKAAAARWMKRAAELDQAIIAESARWGGYRRNPPYTRDHDWLREQRRLLENYFPRRTAIVLAQLRAAGLYSEPKP
jgi:hypothetical protein